MAEVRESAEKMRVSTRLQLKYRKRKYNSVSYTGAVQRSACSLVISVTPQQQEVKIKCGGANSLAVQGPLSKGRLP